MSDRASVLSDLELQNIRAFLKARSERALVEALLVSRQSLARLLGGLPVHRGTLALVRERLRALNAETSSSK